MELMVWEGAANSRDTGQSHQTSSYSALHSGRSAAYSSQCYIISNMKLCPDQIVAPSECHFEPTYYFICGLFNISISHADIAYM
jgi:hypothetical protein